jgi:HEAT repeat protein
LVGWNTPEEWVALIRDPDGATSAYATYELSRLGPAAKPMVPRLIDLLQDENVYVRTSAVVILGDIGSDAKAAIPYLIIALQDPEVRVRINVPHALASIDPGDESIVPALRLAQNDAGEICGYRVNDSAVAALRKIADAKKRLAAERKEGRGL